MRLLGGISKLQSILLYCFVATRGVSNKSPAPHDLSSPLHVSLTSYPPRFGQLHATLISLLNQTVKPDSITLWIASEDRHLLPEKVLSLQKQGLTISFCDDIKSYKKIIPELKLNPESYIVIADDDVYYPRNWLKILVGASSDKKTVVAHRAHKITIEKPGVPMPYNSWDKCGGTTTPSVLNFATGIGGVLYPPSSLHPDTTNERLFMELCPKGDDVWLFWMAQMNGCLVATVGTPTKFYTWVGSQRVGLHMSNTTNGSLGNDQQIKKMLDHFGWPSHE